MINSSDKECGLIFYRKGIEQKERILFDQKHRIGNVCCVLVEGITACDCEYNFFIGDKVFVDPYAKRIVGNEKWRSGEFARPLLRGALMMVYLTGGRQRHCISRIMRASCTVSISEVLRDIHPRR